MKESQEVMYKFVKIVERHPELYNSSLDNYRMKEVADKTWEKIAESVRSELKEDCTAEELRLKWRGVRSSFNRFKNKLYTKEFESNPCKKYYLYDHLRFLDPFTKIKGYSRAQSDASCSKNWMQGDDDDDNPISNDYIEFEEYEIKPDIDTLNVDSIEADQPDSEEDNLVPNKRKKRHERSKEERRNSEDSEDMNFFKSILSDIRGFTPKEKRKFKMGVLTLIDQIDGERKIDKNNEVSSS